MSISGKVAISSETKTLMRFSAIAKSIIPPVEARSNGYISDVLLEICGVVVVNISRQVTTALTAQISLKNRAVELLIKTLPEISP
jgi:hypothetical protein